MYGAVLWAIVGASALHVGEEYLLPGGFLRAMREVAPRFAGTATPRFAVLVNGAFLVLVILAAVIGGRALLFSLSVAALVGFNGVGHCLGSLRLRSYLPGTLTGVALYLPLSVLAYVVAIHKEHLALDVVVAASVLGLAWNAIPPVYLVIRAQSEPVPR